MTIHLSIISPEKVLFDKDVERVLLPGKKAPFVVLPGHAPIISSLTAGEVVFKQSGNEEERVRIEGGFAEFSSNKLVVCMI